MRIQMVEEKKMVMSFRVSKEEMELINDLIEETGLSRSNLFRECVNLYLSKIEEERNGSN